MPSSRFRLQPRLRFSDDRKAAFGPGKAELLQRIAATGSIRSAAAEMAMAYSRAWTMVREINGLFREPLVVMARGGDTGGGAGLTPSGKQVLTRYKRMEKACAAATRVEWKAMQRLLG